MSRVEPVSLTAPDEIASTVVSEFAAENSGVAEVMPADRIEDHLQQLDGVDALDDEEYEELYVDVKDAVLQQDVIIA